MSPPNTMKPTSKSTKAISKFFTINYKHCERWKLILATTKVKILSKERMTKN
jgi:hypothetical protein